MKEMYENNADFRQYVDKYAHNANITPEEALHHAIVEEVAAVRKDKARSADSKSTYTPIGECK